MVLYDRLRFDGRRVNVLGSVFNPTCRQSLRADISSPYLPQPRKNPNYFFSLPLSRYLLLPLHVSSNVLTAGGIPICISLSFPADLSLQTPYFLPSLTRTVIRAARSAVSEQLPVAYKFDPFFLSLLEKYPMNL